MKTGLIADIQRASFHDGTGIRTTVFFKGCPLSCKWCHNPECISNRPQILFYSDKCIGCGMCDKGCYAGARVICGKEMTSHEVLEQVMQDILYYRGGGGVTFSGGEPFLQKEFLKECIMLCREHGIGCAVETSMFFFDEEIFSMLDLVMADLKVWDSQLHRQYTGVGNEIILENFQKLNRLEIPIFARTPVIPEIDQGIEQISAFLYGLKNVKKYELLPYHAIGNAKKEALGMDIPVFSVPSKKQMEELKSYVFLRT